VKDINDGYKTLFTITNKEETQLFLQYSMFSHNFYSSSTFGVCECINIDNHSILVSIEKWLSPAGILMKFAELNQNTRSSCPNTEHLLFFELIKGK
jgi:hypothetical protein